MGLFKKWSARKGTIVSGNIFLCPCNLWIPFDAGWWQLLVFSANITHSLIRRLEKFNAVWDISSRCLKHRVLDKNKGTNGSFRSKVRAWSIVICIVCIYSLLIVETWRRWIFLSASIFNVIFLFFKAFDYKLDFYSVLLLWGKHWGGLNMTRYICSILLLCFVKSRLQINNVDVTSITFYSKYPWYLSVTVSLIRYERWALGEQIMK